MQKYVFGLDLHPVNICLKKFKHKIDVYSPDLYTLTNQLQDYKSINAVIDSIYIYYPKAALILGDLGCFPAQSYRFLQKDCLIYNDCWNGIIKDSDGFIVSKADEIFGFYYLKILFYKGEKVGCIVVKVNTNELLRNVTENISSDMNYHAYGILYNEKLINYTGSSELVDIIDLNPASVKNRSTDVLALTSSVSPRLQYVSLYSYVDIFSPLYILLGICVLSFFAICFAALYLSYFISLRNLKPLNLLSKQVGIDPFLEQDTIKAISTKIDDLINQKDIQIAKLQLQQDILNGLFLADMIETPCITETDAFLKSRQYDIIFELPFFTVCVITNVKEDNPELKKDLISFFREHQFEAIVSYKADTYIILLNIQEFSTPYFFCEIMQQVGSVFFEKACPSIGIGLCYDKLIDIPKSYTEAVWAATEQKQSVGDTVFCYNKFDVVDDYGYNDFRDALYKHDYLSAASFISEIFDNPHLAGCPHSKMEYVFEPVKRILLDCLSTADKNKFFDIKKTFSFDTPADLKNRCLRLIQILRKNEPSGTRLAEKAKRIIERDFKDPMFGTYRIAEELKISNSYLSTVFKNIYNIGTVQYITQLRIETAKRLIMTTESDIKEIAAAVGFSSDISFIRVFKKYESITPGKLRKNKEKLF
ncbi:helix-turn-helix domain-containing protein [Treponema sp. HNW]|uniref:helix-turn-helix domain-containing protein n=1 Tax=Treponema sp. HNW TaxID=3116654 RepID=UPI003D1348C6